MRIIIVFLFFNFLSLTSNAQSSGLPVKALHVDGFSAILGNPSKEDSLLKLAQYNGINYLALYEVFQIHTTSSLTTVASAQPFADFIKKAKEIHGIKDVGVIGENFWFFKNCHFLC